MKILVTGGLGWTAEAIVQALVDAGHEMTLFDLEGIPVPDSYKNHSLIRGDVCNFQEVLEATRGVNVVIHLAVAVTPGAYDSGEIPFAVNVRGTYNALEAARLSGVQQVILMGSAPVHIAHDLGRNLGPADRVSCMGEDHLYDLTKRLQEEIAEDFANTFSMSVLVLRAGHIVDGIREVDPSNRPLTDLDYCRGFWVCRYDVANACLHGVKNPSSGYNCYHIIGGPEGRNYFDLWRTSGEFGFTPNVTFDKFGV